MRIAILGTRGIPANYGGFETFAEELATRLVERGHEVTVYCRSHHTPRGLESFRGVRLVVLPTIRHKYLDTVVHALASSAHAMFQRYDAALFCNAATSVGIPLLKLSRTPVGINVDGLEWKRKKWNRLGKLYYRFGEKLACLTADAIVTDAEVVQSYYRDAHRRSSTYIPYGAPVEKATSVETIRSLGLEPGRYFLYVSRFEPENNAHLVIEAFERADSPLPLVMVGDAPYAHDYIARLKKAAGPRVLFTGYVFGTGYRELMSHAFCYIHATEVGGTHPALVEAMGMGNGVLAADTPENRETAGDGALFFSLEGPEELAAKIRDVVARPRSLEDVSARARARVARHYDWTAVTAAYETLFASLSKPSLRNGVRVRKRWIAQEPD